MKTKFVLILAIFIVLLSSVVWGQEAKQDNHLLYTAQPTLEYDQIENIGNGYFAAAKYSRQPMAGRHFRGVYFLDSTGKVLDIYDYNYIREGGEGLYTAGGMQDGKFGNGYIDKNGKIIIPLIYTGTNPFQEGLAAVGIGSRDDYREGFINTSGETVIPFIYDEVGSFKDGLARVQKDWKWGYIDKMGSIIIPIQYDNISDFQEGYARIRENGLVGYIDKMGAVKIPPQYTYCSDFFNGQAFAATENDFFIIDKAGKKIKSLPPFTDAFFLYRQYGDKGYTGYFSIETIINLPDGDHEHQIDRYNNAGEKATYFEYELVKNMSEGLAGVHEPEGFKMGYVDEKGNTVIPFMFDQAEGFIDGYALVKVGDKYGIIKNPNAE